MVFLGEKRYYHEDTKTRGREWRSEASRCVRKLGKSGEEIREREITDVPSPDCFVEGLFILVHFLADAVDVFPIGLGKFFVFRERF